MELTDRTTNLVMHNNVLFIINEIVDRPLQPQRRLLPIFKCFIKGNKTKEEIYQTLILLAFDGWCRQWHLETNPDNYFLFMALVEPHRESIELRISNVLKKVKDEFFNTRLRPPRERRARSCGFSRRGIER